MAEDEILIKENGDERKMGVQPLHTLLLSRGLTNHDVVAAATEPLTHKAVQRARSGRRLTAKTQQRVVAAVNLMLASRNDPDAPQAATDMFNYIAK